MKHTPLFALAALVLAPAAYAQSLTLNSGDAVTVSGAGTVGTVGGAPVSDTTSTYSSSGYAVTTQGTATFTLDSGGSLTATGTSGRGLNAAGDGPITITGGTLTATRDVSSGLYASGSSPITITGGTFTATGEGGVGLFANGSGLVTITGGTLTATGNIGYALLTNSSGSITITGGTFTAGQNGFGLYASGNGTIDLYGMFDNLTLGQAQTLPAGNGSFKGTLQNNTAPQTFTYKNSGIITLHNTGIAPAPEPSQYAAFAVGLLGLGALVVKAKRRTA